MANINDVSIPAVLHQSHISSKVRSGKNLIWSFLLANYCNLNFIGSKLNNDNVSLVFVIRNREGDVLLASAKAIGQNISVIQSEAWALREGISGAPSLSISHLIIEGEKLGVINSMYNSWQIP